MEIGNRCESIWIFIFRKEKRMRAKVKNSQISLAADIRIMDSKCTKMVCCCCMCMQNAIACFHACFGARDG